MANTENPLVSIDVETTGLTAGYHEIIEIAMIKLWDDGTPTNDLFHSFIKPHYPERMSEDSFDVHHIDLDTLKNCPTSHDIIPEIELWIKSVSPDTKQITPLGQNYMFDQGFIQNMIGRIYYNKYFSRDYEDTKITSTYINRIYRQSNKPKPFPSTSLGDLCMRFNIPHPKKHSAIEDARVTALVYNKLITLQK